MRYTHITKYQQSWTKTDCGYLIKDCSIWSYPVLFFLVVKSPDKEKIRPEYKAALNYILVKRLQCIKYWTLILMV